MAFQAQFTTASRRLEVEDFERLHAHRIDGAEAVRSMLERLRREGVALRRAMNKMIVPERAWIQELGEQEFSVRTENFRKSGRAQQFYSFELAGRSYCFATDRRGGDATALVHLAIPEAIHHVERRDQVRRPAAGWVTFEGDGARRARAALVDRSERGLAVAVEAGVAPAVGSRLTLGYGDESGPRYAEVRSREQSERPGWLRLGLATSHQPRGQPVEVEVCEQIVDLPVWARLRQQLQIGLGGLRVALQGSLEGLVGYRPPAPEIDVIEYANEQGEKLSAILDSWGDLHGATAVMIPPAWGRTKETLLPLARTIVATFRRQRQPVVVIRFDGIRKRGESHNDPGYFQAGDEQLRFTFSQGLRDLEATCGFLDRDPRFQPRRKLVVSFSAASVEARRFAAEHPGAVDGWVCVVGTADLQSMMRVISGGLDYIAGLEMGVRFGRQEVLGVLVDIDRAGLDAIEQGMADLEDARADMARIEIPVVWIRGRYDAWMDVERVEDILAIGDSSKRRHLEVPTGHQLGSSREALATFQRVAQEIADIALGRRIIPEMPDIVELSARQRAERRRLPAAEFDTSSFWRDYLLGRDGGVGIELMHETSSYRELMDRQIELLELAPGHRVLDVGSGTGAFPLALAREVGTDYPAEILELDLVPEALARARARIDQTALPESVELDYRALDLARVDDSALARGRYDRALASLLLPYLDDPGAVLRRIRAALAPGGRIVVSSLRRDADISRIYREGLAELEVRGAAAFGLADHSVRSAARAFLNDAARLVDYEELGAFRFYDARELARLVAKAGFRVESTEWAFGDPPQACIVVARRR